MSASPESYRAVVTRLSAAQKSHLNAPAYSRWVNRPLGRRIAAAAYLRGLTPNQVTGISAAFTFAGIVALMVLPPSPVLGLAVSLALVAGYAFDSADGQLARLRGGGSALGEWLDHVVDSVKNIAVHLAVAVSWFRVPPDVGGAAPGGGGAGALLAVPVLYAVVASTFFFAMTLTDQLRRQGRTSRTAPRPAGGGQAAPVLPSLLTLPNDFGLLIVVFATFGLPAVFVPLYTLLLLANVAFLAVGLRRWSRELRQAHPDR
jgi:phosphatidylglycerophosphate synthase